MRKAIFFGGNCPGENCSWSIIFGAIIRGRIIWGAIIRGAITHGVIVREAGNYPGDNFPRGQLFGHQF